MRRALCLVCACCTAAVALPASAHATLVYDKSSATPKPSVYVASNDGSSPRRLGRGLDPDLAPDGKTVVWADPDFSDPKLVASPTASSAPRTLVADWRGTGLLDWSPDSSRIATAAGPELGSRRLVLVDVATREATTVATGYFGGVSFSPAGDQLVFSEGTKDDFKVRPVPLRPRDEGHEAPDVGPPRRDAALGPRTPSSSRAWSTRASASTGPRASSPRSPRRARASGGSRTRRSPRSSSA